jgi:hypothetical protein
LRDLDFDIEEEALRVLGGWLTGEWFWYQSNMMQQIIDKEEAKEILQRRLESISSEASQ